MYFYNPFGIIRLTVMTCQIVKYYNLQISILHLQLPEPLYFPVIWSLSLTLLSPATKNLLHIQHLLLDVKFLLSSTDMTRFLWKCFFYHFFTTFIFFKNCFNKFIDCIFSSVKNKWFTKFIINTYNFASKTARSVLFGIRNINIFIITLNSF